MKKRLFYFLFLILASTKSYSQNIFNEVPNVFPQINNAHGQTSDAGDFNNDGYMDLVVQQSAGADIATTTVYKNNGDNTFTILQYLYDSSMTPATSHGSSHGQVSFGDFDNDGYVDILETGRKGFTLSPNHTARIWKNNNGLTFTLYQTWNFPVNNKEPTSSWTDYDSDGDLDILLSNSIYRNDNGNFIKVNVGLGIEYGFPNFVNHKWGDYDKDGDLDLFVIKPNGDGQTAIYRNDDGYFNNSNFVFPQIEKGSADWGDYDNDGDLDLAICGGTNLQSSTTPITKIYKNEGGSFMDSGINLVGAATIWISSYNYNDIRWFDYNCDGRLDIIYLGDGSNDNLTKIYRNDGNNVFTDVTSNVPNLMGLQGGSITIADFNKDSKQDIFIIGRAAAFPYNHTKLFLNTDTSTPLHELNSVVPSMSVNVTGSSAVLSWNPVSNATDLPNNSKPSYGLRVNWVANNTETILMESPLTYTNSINYRTITGLGNTQMLNGWKLRKLPVGEYFCRVNAINSWNRTGNNLQLPTFQVTAQNKAIRLWGDLTKFGNVVIGQNKTITLNIENDGNMPLTVSSISYPAGFSGNWSGGVVPIRGSQNVVVTFNPTQVQTYSGNITINSDAAIPAVNTSVLGYGFGATLASNVNFTSFTANWVGLPTATYRLDVSTNNFTTFVNGYSDLEVTGTSQNVTGLSANTAYQYRLRFVIPYSPLTITSASISPNSNIISVTTLTFPAPIATTATNINFTNFKANWNAVSGAVSYRLDVTDNMGNFISGYNNLSVTGTTQNVTGLQQNRSYYYIVRAVNSVGAISNNSNEIMVTTRQYPPTPVATPATNVAHNSFTANWNIVTSPDVIGYVLHVFDYEASQYVNEYPILLTLTSHNVTGLIHNTKYYYMISCLLNDGLYNTSNGVNYVTGYMEVTTTKKPQTIVFNALPQKTVGDLPFVLSAISGGSGNPVTFTSSNTNVATISGTTVTITGVGTTTIAVNQVGNDDYLDAIPATQNLVVLPISPPQNLTAIPEISFKINLSWQPVNNAIGYKILRSTTSGTAYILIGTVGNTNTFVDNVPSVIGANYFYVVRAMINNFESTNSNEASVIATPIENSVLAETIEIYPNPTSEIIQIKFYTQLQGQIFISVNDINGKNVFLYDDEMQSNVIKIDLSKQAPGTYFLELNTKKYGKITKKILKL